ncbi:hypothetical protein [Salinarimonas rosea]|uniref:hypothetical protein n=1 Tax=Salinarimonas rosea TaxID=552063 RepID=UPI000413F288|nr:hypothetical protein [Salinarimonas rosea]
MPDRTTDDDTARHAAAQAMERDATTPVDDAARPRLTPQNRADPAAAGEDATDPSGVGAKRGQADEAEGGRSPAPGASDLDAVGEALERPSREGGEMHFGARPEEAGREGSADAAVERAAAGWSGERKQ